METIEGMVVDKEEHWQCSLLRGNQIIFQPSNNQEISCPASQQRPKAGRNTIDIESKNLATANQVKSKKQKAKRNKQKD